MEIFVSNPLIVDLERRIEEAKKILFEETYKRLWPSIASKTSDELRFLKHMINVELNARREPVEEHGV